MMNNSQGASSFFSGLSTLLGRPHPLLHNLSDTTTNDRILARLESNGQLYVAANHWPRAWYNQALANPNVQVVVDGEKGAYLAIPVTDEEHDRVNGDNGTGVMFRILTGFPPRYFVRLDPR